MRDRATYLSVIQYLIEFQSWHRKETSLLIWAANQFSGFHMTETFVFWRVKISIHNNLLLC